VAVQASDTPGLREASAAKKILYAERSNGRFLALLQRRRAAINVAVKIWVGSHHWLF
jgi:hypothetical protein